MPCSAATCPATCAPWTVSLEFQCYLLLPIPVFVFWLSRAAGWTATAALVCCSLTTRSLNAAHENFETRTLAPMMCEYLAGVLAYFAFGPGGAVGSGAKPHQVLRRLHLLQAVWLASLVAYVLLVILAVPEAPAQVIVLADGASGAASSNLCRVLLAASAAAFIGISCALSSVEVDSWATGAFRWMSAGLSYLFPLASVSYTGYLVQGIPMNALRLSGRHGDGTMALWFLVVLIANILLGLLLSLLVERPAMKLMRKVWK